MANHVLVRDGGHVASNCGGRGREQAGSERAGSVLSAILGCTKQFSAIPTINLQYWAKQGGCGKYSRNAVQCSDRAIQGAGHGLTCVVLALVLEVVHVVLLVHSGADLQWFLQ